MRVCATGPILLLLLTATVARGGTLPDTPAGHAAEAWLQLLKNPADSTTLASFYEKRIPEGMREFLPLADFLGWHMDLHARRPGIELDAVLLSEPQKIRLRCRAQGGHWLTLYLEVTEDDPPRFANFSTDDAADPPWADEAKPAADREQFRELLQRYVGDRTARDVFSGTVIVAGPEGEWFSAACGSANRRYPAPNTMDTRFNLGSMNKMFTAVAIAQLQARGLLDFQDPVGKYLPDYPNSRVREQVTIHHLLSHTSGMGSHFTEEFMEGSKTRFRTIRDFLPLFAADTLSFAPGERFQYSNAGFFVLGLIVEAASGESYYNYIREHVYAPAGMTRSDCYDADIPVPDIAVGYTRDRFDDPRPHEDQAPWMDTAGGWRENTFLHSMKGGPAGGGYSTAPDLIRFARALTDGTLISRDMLDTLLVPRSKPRVRADGETNEYGYGFHSRTTPGGARYFGHGGGFPGVNGELRIFPETGVVMVALANVDQGAAPILRFAERILPRNE